MQHGFLLFSWRAHWLDICCQDIISDRCFMSPWPLIHPRLQLLLLVHQTVCIKKRAEISFENNNRKIPSRKKKPHWLLLLFLVIGSHVFTLHSVLSAGFGNISPHTEGGRIFCIVYALLGIPLFGFLLAGVGDQLGTIFSKGIGRVEEMFVVSLEKHAQIQLISLEVRLSS